MVNNTSSLAVALAILSSVTTTSAFVQVGRPSVKRSQHSKQLYDASDGSYLEQLGSPSSATTSSSDTTDHEKFQRSLLEAKIAYDAIDNALSKSEDIDYDAPVLNNPQSSSGPLKKEPIVDDECYMGKDGQLDECADFDPLLTVSAAAVSAQPKVVVPVSNKQAVKQSSGELGIVPINEATIEFTAGLLGVSFSVVYFIVGFEV